MAAGLGFKDFTTGEVLTAADVDGYLMQGVWVFASATARDAAVTSPQEGNFAYLKDTNVTTYYTGSAWANLDTTGMTNPMTTTGDTIYSSSGSTPARLGIGTAGQVLQVNSGATAPEWATPAGGGGMTLISETVASANASISLSSIPQTHKQLILVWGGIIHSTGSTQFALRFNNDSTADVYASRGFFAYSTTLSTSASLYDSLTSEVGANILPSFGSGVTNSSAINGSNGYIIIDNYASTTKLKQVNAKYNYFNAGASANSSVECSFVYKSTSAITSLDIVRLTGSATISNFTNTSIRLYGVS